MSTSVPTSGPDNPGTMRYPSGDLAILSAEVYGAGVPVPFRPQTRATATRKTHVSAANNTAVATTPTSTHATGQPGPKKRTRTQATDGPVEEEEKKRTRGRPRLDIKDETAADRRRTQIRLAQRAYRTRKENAIQTLEKRVRELKDTNEEMSNAFMQFHDFAVSVGLLDRVPEFGRQLRTTTERFLALARSAGDDAAADSEDAGAGGDGNVSDSRGSGGGSSHGDRRDVVADAGRHTTPSSDDKPVPLWAGLMVSHEPVLDQQSQNDFWSNMGSSSAASQPTTTTTTTTSALGYEIVTHPTLDNASFPFQTVPGFGLDPPAFQPSLLTTHSLPLPSSYAAQEITFGRRLHRNALEKALDLISRPDASQSLISRVFGFSLMIETRDGIRQRLERILGRRGGEGLYNWEFPFHNLGGAGTRLPESDTSPSNHRIGNQGSTINGGKPANTNGFATGPFTSAVHEVRDRELSDDMRIEKQGFQGEFFDCDEIDMYFFQRGVAIPPAADYVTADVDPDLFQDAAANWQQQMGGSGNNVLSVSSSMSMAPQRTSADSGNGIPAGLPTPPEPDTTGGGGPSWSIGGGGGGGLVDPLLSGVFGSQDSSLLAAVDFGSMGGKRQRIVIDVEKLIYELTKRARCLGRTPGFRVQDVNRAFWASAQVIEGA